ncbi:MAG: hypothetical protein KBE72_11205, partial [Syntrophaceae bacterium]|nr:hypothetical protein [Syntrophaceae bacterium]
LEVRDVLDGSGCLMTDGRTNLRVCGAGVPDRKPRRNAPAQEEKKKDDCPQFQTTHVNMTLPEPKSKKP